MKIASVHIGFESDHLLVAIEGSQPACLRYGLAKFRPFVSGPVDTGVLDLLEPCLALYAVDRLVTRPEKDWSRELRVEFPIAGRRRRAWDGVKRLLKELVWHATGDVLELAIREDNGARHVDRSIVPHCDEVLDERSRIYVA